MRRETGPPPHRYTGVYRDPTGVYKMGHRYYEPRNGRFSQPALAGHETNPCLSADGDPVSKATPRVCFLSVVPGRWRVSA
jgi:RHS repeat-associated protein